MRLGSTFAMKIIVNLKTALFTEALLMIGYMISKLNIMNIYVERENHKEIIMDCY